MKKKLFGILILFTTIPFYAQHSEEEYQTFLKENNTISVYYGFESFVRLTFLDNKTFSIDGFDYHFCDGKYSISNNKIVLDYPYNYIDEIYEKRYLQDLGLNINSSSEIYIDLDISNLFYQGAYIAKEKIFFSDYPSEPYKEYIYEGIKCIKFPVKIKIKENLKIRKTPSLDSEIVRYVKRIDNANDEEYHEYIKNFFVVLKGEKYNVLARTPNEDTIDNIQSPWYLIEIEDYEDFPDIEYRLVWIFGGYTTIME